LAGPALSHSNQALRYRLGFFNSFGVDRQTLSPHRALSDAIVTAALFGEIIKHVTWPEIVRWSGEPGLLSVVRFGKHRGERFDAVPIDYLRWIVEGRNEVAHDVRWSARGLHQTRSEVFWASRAAEQPAYEREWLDGKFRPTPRAGVRPMGAEGDKHCYREGRSALTPNINCVSDMGAFVDDDAT
jgi:hypothetical protein